MEFSSRENNYKIVTNKQKKENEKTIFSNFIITNKLCGF